jgi:hypothetical protein
MEGEAAAAHAGVPDAASGASSSDSSSRKSCGRRLGKGSGGAAEAAGVKGAAAGCAGPAVAHGLNEFAALAPGGSAGGGSAGGGSGGGGVGSGLTPPAWKLPALGAMAQLAGGAATIDLDSDSKSDSEEDDDGDDGDDDDKPLCFAPAAGSSAFAGTAAPAACVPRRHWTVGIRSKMDAPRVADRVRRASCHWLSSSRPRSTNSF